MNYIRHYLIVTTLLIYSSNAWAQLPAITLGVTGNANGCAPHTVVFNLSGFSGNASNTTYAFNFGDGTPIVNYTQSTIPPTVSHTYTTVSCGQTFGGLQNCYGATLTAINTLGSTAGTVQPIRISKKPNSSFTLSASSICAGGSITFTNISDPGVTYTGSICNTNPPYYWVVTGPSAGTLVSGTVGNNNGFPNNIAAWTPGSSPLTMQFTTPGSYQMKLSTGNSCGIDDTTLNFSVTSSDIVNAGTDQGICLNAPAINLTGTPLGGNWSGSPLITTAGLFTPSSVGTYTLTYNIGSGSCTASDQKIVTVYSLPNVSVNDPTICAGSQATLTAVGSGGLGPYTYAWSPSSGLSAAIGSSVTTSPLVSTSYTVTVSDTRSCTKTDVSYITVNTNLPVNAGSDISVCNDSSPYLLSGFSPTGGTWSGPGVSSSGIFTPSTLGNVTLTYSATQAGCSGTDQLVVSVINPTAANAGLDQGVCLNSTSINLTGTPAGGTWSGSSLVTSAGVFTPSSVGIHTLTYTFGTGSCNATDQKIFTVYSLPTVSVNDPSICPGAQATLIATGANGLAPYTYSWSPAEGLSTTTGPSVNAAPASNTLYTVTVSDVRSCTASDVSSIIVKPIPTVNAGNDFSICNISGAYTLLGYSPSGGVWSGSGVTSAGVFTPSALGTITLTYSYTLNGCTGTDQLLVTVISPTAANAGIDQAICKNSASLSLTGTPSGGTWSGSSLVTSTGVFTPSTAGVYTLTYEWGIGSCNVSDQKIITVYSLPTVSVNDPTICGGTQTTLSAEASGGLAPYTYSWTPATGLSATTGESVTTSPSSSTSYTVTVNDVHSCTASDVSSITVNSIPTVNAGSDLTTCNDQPLTLTGFSPAGGTWSGSGITNPSGSFLAPVSSGAVTITYSYSQNGCIGSDQIVVNVTNQPISVNAGPDQSICAGGASIQLTGIPSGGTWSGPGVTPSGIYTPPASGATIVPLTYSVTGTPNCIGGSDQLVIVVNPKPTITVSPSASTICAGSSVSLSASSNLSGTVYSWSPSSGLDNSSGNPVNASPTTTSSYTAIGTVSSTGCSASSSAVLVNVNPIPTVNAGIDVSICSGSGNNTLTGYSPAGGTWSGTGVTAAGSFTPTSLGNVTLTYSVTQNGCTGTDQIVVTVIAPTAANAGADQGLCLNAAPINLTGTPSGGSWTSTSMVTSAGQFTPSAVGTYTLTYNFGTGSCSTTDQKVVTVYSLPSVTVNDPTICAGTQATLNAVGSNGLAPYTYAWSPSAGLSAVSGAIVTTSPTTTTSYTVTVSDAHSCTASDVSSITVNPIPTVNAGADFSVCNQPVAYTLSGASPSGGIWSGTGVTASGVFTPSASGSITLTYSVTQIGCTGTDQIVVQVSSAFTANAGADQPVCLGTGSITLAGVPTGGVWSGSSAVNSAGVFTPTQLGTYNLTYTVGSGNCAASDNVVVSVINFSSANAGIDQAICANPSAINLTGTPTGGTWSGAPIVTSAGVFTPSIAGTYTLTYTYGTGSCASSDVKIITVNSVPTVSVNDVTTCAGEIETLTATVANGLAPYTYTWSPSAGLSSTTGASVTTSPFASTNYTVTVSDAHSCTSSDVSNITVNPIPIVNAGSDVSFCNGLSNNTLTGFSPSGGTWSGTGVTSAGIFTPSTLGSFTLTYSVTQNGCTGTDQIVVSVISPTLANAGIDRTVCFNSSSFTLTGSPTGGTWSGDVLVTSAGVFNPTVLGDHTLTYTYGSGSCLTTDEMIVNVNAPTVNAGSDVYLCQSNEPFTLTSGLPNGGAWTGNSISNGAFTPSTVGNTTITYSYTENGCTSTDQLIAYVLDTLTINAGSDYVFCIGDNTLQLTGNPIGGYWIGSPFVSNSGAFYSTEAGIETISYVVDNTNCITADEIQITVVDTPSVYLDFSNSTFCNSETAIFLNIGNPGGGIYTGPGIANNLLNATQLPLGVSPISYSYSNNQGCNSVVTGNITIDPCTGIETKINQNTFQIYPNPSQGLVFIESTKALNNYQIFIFNGLGEKIKSIESNSMKQVVDLSSFSSGIYLIRIIENGLESTTQKIVLKNQ